MKRIWVVFCLLMAIGSIPRAQENYYWTHYTAEDGLSQNVVTSILQDHRGLMWFATWDGLSRFDGNKFTTYKIRPGDEVNLSSSRIDYISEDPYGYLWLLAYGKNVSRFDPVKEEFINVPENPHQNIIVDIFETLPGGTTWLLSEDNGAVRVLTDPQTGAVKSTIFSQTKGNISSDVILDVFEDKDGNEWLLTDNGLCFVGNGKIPKPRMFLDQKIRDKSELRPFYCAKDFGEEIWFGSNQGNIWKYNKETEDFSLLKLSTFGNIKSFHLLRQREWFIATFSDGFFIYRSKGEEITHYSKETTPSVKSNIIYHTFKDSYGNIWIQQDLPTFAGFNGMSGEVTNYEIAGHAVSDVDQPGCMIQEDVNGILWIHPLGGGVSYYDRQNDEMVSFFKDQQFEAFLSDRLHSMYSDKQGNLWMSTRARGLEKFVFAQGNFHLKIPEDSPRDINDNTVRAVAADRSGRIWLANKTGKIFIYDEQRRFKGYLGADGQLYNDAVFSDANTYAIEEGHDGVMWIGTKGEGLFRATPCIGNKGEICFRIEKFAYHEEDPYSLSNNNIYDIFEDDRGCLWIATFGGGINYLENPGQYRPEFISYRNHLSHYPMETCYRSRLITKGPGDEMWVATTNGVVVFDRNFTTPEKIDFRHYTYTAGDPSCLSNNDVHDIIVTSDSTVYMATFGGGLNKMLSAPGDSLLRFEHYFVEDGMPSDVVFSLLEDSRNNLWMTTENGLAQMNPHNGTFRNYHCSDYAYNLNFSEAADVKDHKGFLWFGNQQGVLWFHPDMLSKSSFVPPLIFTDLRLFNRSVIPETDGVLEKPVNRAEKVVFGHHQNIFSIGFSALDYKYPESVKYKVKLDGFDEEWRYIDGQRMVSYTNIPHGQYTFKVRSTNSDGVWVDNERQLSVIVLPSFWETSWAYVLYVLFFLMIVGVGGYVLTTILHLRHRAELEHQVGKLKLDFFTNVSHELRTPLTLISAPLEEVLREEGLSGKVKERLHTIKKNSDRMLRMIDQILDFVKINHKKMELRVEQIPLKTFISQVMDNFSLRAREEKIDFSFDQPESEVYLWADADKLEKILFNLLSNAFKYLGEGHRIKVSLREKADGVEVVVSDDGMGMSAEKMDRLFERFENNLGTGIPGQHSTGIGLSVVREFVELHGGTISVHQPGDGEAETEFRLLFLSGCDHFGDDVEILDAGMDAKYLSGESDVDGFLNEIECIPNDSETDRKTSVLLVEDNEELREFIKSILLKKYQVVEAANGEDGFGKAMEVQPDLIVSDLMMPVMDGVTFLQKLRADIVTSHIPFIILTAKSNLEARLQGLEYGADAYITKPFSTAYLAARVENLLHQRKQLYQKYAGDFSPLQSKKVVNVDPSRPQITSLDEKFLMSVKEFMEKNMDNDQLLVEDIVLEIGMSRSVFFKKMKSLTGMAPIEFIRDFRLKRSAQLMEAEGYNINQIAMMVGITDARYFSKCFKSKYGMSPSEYRMQLLNNKESG